MQVSVLPASNVRNHEKLLTNDFIKLCTKKNGYIRNYVLIIFWRLIDIYFFPHTYQYVQFQKPFMYIKLFSFCRRHLTITISETIILSLPYSIEKITETDFPHQRKSIIFALIYFPTGSFPHCSLLFYLNSVHTQPL